MKKLTRLSLLVAAALVGALSLAAQPAAPVASTGKVSPHETTSVVTDGNRVTITYGRPFSKNPKGDEIRKIWGGVVPWDAAWRTGSDEATLLLTQKAIMFGDTEIPAGAYTLYTIPSESGTSKLVFSKKVGQWGVPVDEKNDLAKVDLKKESLEPRLDQFTVTVEKNPAGGGIIKLKWENTQYSAAYTVKK